MTTLTRSAVAVVLTASAIGWAGPASADPLSGAYTATVTGTLGGDYLKPPVGTWVFTPCGPDCLNVDNPGMQLHPQDGGGWSGTYVLHAVDNGETVTCTRGIGPDLTTASDVCPQPLGLIVNFQLTKI